MNKMVMVYLANKLHEDIIKKLRITFIEIDANKNGYISVEELNDFFRDQHEISADMIQIQEIFKSIDLNQNGLLEYSEFIAATLRRHIKDKLMRLSGMDSEEILKYKSKDEISKHILTTFQLFDIDQTGYLSKENFESFIDEPEFIDLIITQVDSNGDGKIDLAEFIYTLFAKCDDDQSIVEYMVNYYDI